MEKQKVGLAYQGKLALIVENEVAVAIDLSQTLRTAGFLVRYSASNLPQALDLVDREQIDIALVAISLGEEQSLPVARALREKGIPYIFIIDSKKEAFLLNEFPEALPIQRPIEEKLLWDGLARLRCPNGPSLHSPYLQLDDRHIRSREITVENGWSC